MPQSTPPYVQSLRDSIRPRNLEGTTLCLVRSVADDSIDASFDFGENWHAFPLSEIISAETVRTVTLANASYQLVLLQLQDDHPRIEIAALQGQVRALQANGGCSCGDQKAPRATTFSKPTDPSGQPCLYQCAGLEGCAFWRCVWWCALQHLAQ